MGEAAGRFISHGRGAVAFAQNAITFLKCTIVLAQYTFTLLKCTIVLAQYAITLLKCTIVLAQYAITFLKCTIVLAQYAITLLKCTIVLAQYAIALLKCPDIAFLAVMLFLLFYSSLSFIRSAFSATMRRSIQSCISPFIKAARL